MSKIAIVTDTGAYLPPELLKEYPIFVVPFLVVWGEETFQDTLDITSEEFYKRLKTADILPSTSQPSMGAFKEIYEKLLEEGYEILSIHTSAKLSGTLDSATQAAKLLHGAPIELLDSESVSMALGFQVLAAARAAEKGADLQECKRTAETARGRTSVYFVVETLEFLKRGGRIGGGAAFLGNVLNLKPILQIKEGSIQAAGKVRTMAKSVSRMMDLVVEEIGECKKLRICALHTDQEEKAQKILEKISRRFPSQMITEAFLSGVSPAVGVHAGPGCVGLAFLVDM